VKRLFKDSLGSSGIEYKTGYNFHFCMMIDLRSLKLDINLQKTLNQEALNGDFIVFVYISMLFCFNICRQTSYCYHKFR
jgi:hypothetical protein